MKRFEKSKRVLAFLLVALMVVQQSSVTILADEQSADIHNVQNQEETSTEEKTGETPEEKVQETVTPEPENKDEQTSSDEQPEEKEDAVVTVTPAATEEAETTATPTEAAKADTEDDTAKPSITETPVEATTTTEFSGAVDNATANVSLSQPISDKAIFVANQYSVESDYFTNNAETAITQWVEANNLTVLDAVAYDMHFEENGQEISVSQHADVNLSFSSPILSQTADIDVPSQVYVLHVVNGQAVSAGTATQDSNGAVTAANISTDGFSPFVFIKATNGDAVQTTEAEQTTDLNRFVTNISLKESNGNDIPQENGVYQLRPETDYKLKLSFQENKDLQYANNEDGKLYYTLPAGITIPDDIAPTQFKIGDLEGNTFSYHAGSNQIEVQININGGDKYNEFKGAGDAFFDLEFNVQFQRNMEQIVFGNTKTVKVYVDSTNGLALDKTAKYNSDNGTVSYTVTVTSTGISENVIVTDTLSGSWLKMYSADDVTITSNKNNDLSEVTKSVSGRVMTVTIPSMTHGEVITITYTVQVDYDKVASVSTDIQKANTLNTVSVNRTDVENVSVNADVEYKPAIAKTASVNANNKITYTITLNSDYRYDISGKTITDVIPSAARRFGEYSGTGITVTRYSSGNTTPVDSVEVPWKNIISPEAKDYTWSYRIPSEHRGKYKYIITYTFQGENHEITGATITNTVSYDTGGSATSKPRIYPLDGMLKVEKTGSIVTDQESGEKRIQWNVTFNIPAGKEYTGCKIEDWLPSTKIDNKTYADAYVDGSAEIMETVDGSDPTTLEEDTAYNLVYDIANNKITVYFTNLGKSDKNRVIKFTYLTIPNETWLKNSSASVNNTHTNRVGVTARNQYSNDIYASVELYENNPEISKKATVSSRDAKENAKQIRYEIAVSGVEGDKIEITDEFNTSQLELDSTKKLEVKYSNDGKNYTTDSKATVDAQKTDDGRKFVISDFSRNGENNYKYYKLTYYLNVKDLESIETSSEGGTVQNKATFRGEAATVDTKVVGTPGIIKKELSNEATIAADKYIAEYKLIINPGKKQYGKSDTLVVEDKMTNMTAIKRDDVKIKTVPESNKDKVTAVFKNDGIDFTVPNATEVEITYKAKWTGSGNVDHVNEVTVYGYSQSVSKKANVSSQGSGGYSNLHLTIYKVEDGNDIKLLSGAKFSLEIYENGEYIPVRERNGKPVTITTEENGKAVLQGHEGDRGWVLWKDYKYRLIETKAPDGYILDTTPHEFTFSQELAANDPNVTYCENGGELTIKNKPIEIEISKVSLTGNEELAGAELKITKGTDENGEVVASWTSGKEAEDKNADGSAKPHKVKLVAGTYTLRERKAPTGYDRANPITFTVALDGTVTSTPADAVSKDGDKTTITMKDALTEREIEISKVSLTGNEELAGAELEIRKGTDENGELVESWTSGKEAENKNEDGSAKPHKVKLVAGTYTLSEGKAPTGYNTASKITFTVNLDGTVTSTTAGAVDGKKVTMKDALTEREIEISKVDAADGVTELAGAKLQITDEAGNIVKDKAGNELSWTTGESAEEQNEDGSAKPHKVKLVAGTYILKEVSAPFGYLMADSITFTVGLDGTLSSKAEGAVLNDENKAVVTMKDVAKEKSAASSISVTKRLKTVAGEDILAADETFYVALYADEGCTQRVSDVKALTFKMDSVSTVTFTDLAVDTTYYIGECTADGVNYLKGQTADGTTYAAMFSNGNSVEIGSNGGNKAVEFENRFVKFPDGFYKEALLNLTKQLKNSDGEDKNSTETFYAGIFADEDFTTLSDQVSQNIVPLNLNGNSSADAQIKVAIADSGSTTLYVTEVDADGKPVGNADSFEYDLSVDTESITFNESNKAASVTLVNQERAEDEDEGTEEEEIKEKITKNTPTPTSSVTPTKSTQTTNSVKTGDNTPIGIFVVLLIAAIAVIGGGIYLKRRKK